MKTEREFITETQKDVVTKLLLNNTCVSDFLQSLYHYYEIEYDGINYRLYRSILKYHDIIPTYKNRGCNQENNEYKYLEEWLKNQNNHVKTHAIKKKLFIENIKRKKCELCGIETWNGKDAPLELHHVDGNKHNVSVENFQILCPNCHAQTDTYKSKNSKRSIEKKRICKMNVLEKKQGRQRQMHYCVDCGKELKSGKIRCVACSEVAQRKVLRPSYEELLQEIKETSYTAVGKRFGVTDNAIRKWIKYYENQNPLSQPI